MGVMAILTEGLERRFGNVKALQGIDLAVQQGEMYALLGANGAGKSTLMRILCTLLRPTRGHAQVSGLDVVSEPDSVRARIGVALQSGSLSDRETGREFLRLQARLHGFHGQEIGRRVARTVELVDLGDAIDRRIGAYSGGMKRRLELAGALIHDPEVLFLDEPTVGLDPASRLAAWAEIRHLSRDLGTTVFLTTQQLDEADQLAERIGIIDRGCLVAEGTPEQLRRVYGRDVIVAEVEGVDAAFLASAKGLYGVDQLTLEGQQLTIHTSDGARSMAAVAVALHDHGVAVHSLSLRRPTLDDIFLTIMSNKGIAGECDDDGPASAAVKDVAVG